MPSPAAAEFRKSWLIVLLALLGMCFGGSGVLWYSFGVLISPLQQAYGWSSSVISGWAFFVSVGSMIGLPTAGRLADRFGVRPVVLTAMPLCAAAISLGSVVGGRAWALYAVAVLVGTLAAGISSLTYSRLINGWFFAARGAALGIMSSGIGLGAAFGPRVVQAVVDRFGLNAGFMALAVALLLPLPLMLLFLRERRNEAGAAGSGRVEEGLTRGAALKTRVFWLLGTAMVLWTLCTGGNFHLIPYLTSGGLSRPEAAYYAGLLGVTAMLGRLITGFILDRLHAPWVGAFVFVVEAGAFVSLGLIEVKYAFIPIMVIGFAHGAEVDCFAYCTARYFGMRSYGAIFGFLSLLSAIGTGLGPLLFGLMRDTFGTYSYAFYAAGALALLAAGTLLAAGRQRFLVSDGSA